MKRIGQITTFIAIIIYLILMVLQINNPIIFNLVFGIVLIGQSIDEFNRYRETNQKLHLFTPIIATIIIIVIIAYSI